MTLHYPECPENTTLNGEILWRKEVIDYLAKTYAEGLVPSQELQELRVYRGAAGFWGDKTRTKNILTPYGLCVSLLHTGKTYADAVTNNHIFYHYPKTKRPGSTDANEVAAARAANEYRVPIFVILPGKSKSESTREVRLGWIVADITEENVFVVEFSKSDPGRLGTRLVGE